MKKTITYIENPFFIYDGRVRQAPLERIEIYKGSPVYTFILEDNSRYIIYSDDVYETEREARDHL